MNLFRRSIMRVERGRDRDWKENYGQKQILSQRLKLKGFSRLTGSLHCAHLLLIFQGHDD
jgi:hypothetical protein